MRQNGSQLRIAVLGATGGTGRAVTATALARGHRVVALVRRSGSLSAGAKVREMVWSDLDDPEPLIEAFDGADVVISALGGAPKGPTTVCTDGIRSALAAMAVTKTDRLIAVSAHGVAESHDRSLYSRSVWAGVADKMRDKEAMEDLIVGSPVTWTIVRPPMLRDRAATGRATTGVDLPIRLWSSIGRADLAGFLVQESETPQYIGAFPRIVG